MLLFDLLKEEYEMKRQENLFSVVVFILISLVFFSIFFYTPKRVGFITGSSVTINTPPEFNNSRPLPNITFPEDTTVENAIDLNRSFFDPDGDTFIFKVFGNSSVIVTINATTKNVTLSAERNFNGIEQIYFVGDDGFLRNATSNNVTVNVTPVTDVFWAYSGTNFSLLNLSQLINFSIFNDFGKVNYTFNVVNFSANNSRGEDINLTKHVNISSNRIEVNSTHMPELNESAELTLNGLTFDDPRPLRNGEICPSDICTELSFGGGDFVFNVTSFTIYSSEETPGITAKVVGGGPGRRPPFVTTFVVEPEALKVRLRHGETVKQFFKIKNNMNKEIELTLDLTNIREFLIFQEGEDITKLIVEFTLSPGEEKLIQLTFFVTDDFEPDVYLKSLTLKAGEAEQEVPVIIEILSRDIVFDLTVEISEEYKEILLGESLLAKVTVFRLKEIEGANITVYFIVRDFSGKEIMRKSKTIFVESSVSFTEELFIPEIAPGKYILIAKTTFDGKTAVASDTFKVVERVTFALIFFFLLGILAVVIILTTILLRKAVSRRRLVRELERLHSLIAEAHEYARIGDRRDALRLYKIVKQRFDKLPSEGKRRIQREARGLAKEIGI